MNIQWYPGHMTKTRRQMENDVKLVDLVAEVVHFIDKGGLSHVGHPHHHSSDGASNLPFSLPCHQLIL